ncbi:MAG: hypothetical protein ACRD9Q_04345 [Nitrososphaeraceae archaeon]
MKVDLSKATKGDIQRVLGVIEKSNYAEWTKHEFKVTLKRFYKWLRGSEDYPPEVRWIKTTIKNIQGKLPEEFLSEERLGKQYRQVNTLEIGL